jgi:condensin-2 complex subunit D3
MSRPLRAAWLAGVLPLARDGEAAVAEAALEAVLDTLLAPLARAGPDGAPSTGAWPLLAELPLDRDAMLGHAVRTLARQRRLPTNLAPVALALLAPGGVPAAAPARRPLWCVLHELASQSRPERGADAKAVALDGDALVSCWRAGSTGADAADGADAAAALRVLTVLSRRGDLAAPLCAEVGAAAQAALFSFESPSAAVADLVAACSALTPDGEGVGKPSLAQAYPSDSSGWSSRLMAACEAGLAHFAASSPGAAPAAEHAAAADGAATDGTIQGGRPRSNSEGSEGRHQLYLLVAGELALSAPSRVTPRLVVAVQACLEASEREGALLSETSGALAATALVTLGKFCCVSTELTKRLLPVFMRELDSSPSAAVRNNALVVLLDLAKKHTALLDRHVPTIALATSDASPLVRHQAVALLTQLLVEDYVKWRPSLFRAFCAALADAEPPVRATAHGCFFELLLPRSPLLAYNGFLPLLFQLHGVAHVPHHPAALPPAERDAIEMVGEGYTRRRLCLLRALLARMTDEQKLSVTSKLCLEVLAAVPDGAISLERAHSVLADALMLLACKEIKLAPAATGSAATADDEAGGGSLDADGAPVTAASAVCAAKARLLSGVARKAMVESIMPIVIELKRY